MLEKPWSVALLISPIATTKYYNSWAYSRDVNSNELKHESSWMSMKGFIFLFT